MMARPVLMSDAGRPEQVSKGVSFLAGFFLLFVMPDVFAAERLYEARDYLGTSVAATVCHDPAQQDKAKLAMKTVWQRFADIHARMDAFDPASDVSLLNGSSGQEVRVHDDVYRLLERAKGYFAMTRGVLDISVRPLTVLWQRVVERGSFPTVAEILEAKALIGADRIGLGGDGGVTIPRGMKIDFGGIAAGFAADEAAGIFRAAGFRDFLVNAGGEIYAGGQACEGRPWRVGVNDPEGKGRFADVLELRDQALSTSGGYEKYFEINGERWSHIINPLTGYPARGIVSATVIAPHALDADAFSTALCVLGAGPGFRLIDDLGAGYAAMLITENVSGKLEQRATQGYAVFRVK